ncbi:hypothetical protein Tco_0240760 [Tanacetum coccineum]
MFSIIYEPVHGIIYKNNKKEKRVMRHSEIHKFCDATLNRILEGLKSYNNDVKYGYVQRELTNDEVEYLKLFEEEIERERERKARTTLLMSIPKDHLAKFHKMNDAKEMWEAIKSRFGGNDESKKMQKYILKQQCESFSVSNSEGLHKGIITQEASSSYTDELMYSFFTNQSSGPQLDHEDIEQVDEFDLEEMNLKWQVAMISMRLKKIYKKTGKAAGHFAKDADQKEIKKAEGEMQGTLDIKQKTMGGDLEK